MGNGEEFHTNSVCLGNVDNAPNQQDKIIVGSFEGRLRVFTPQPRPFKSEDVLLDKDLGMPILQLKCARELVNPRKEPDGSVDSNALAILHTRRFVIASVKQGYQPVHSHDFQRNLFNFTIGHFGSRYPMVCI